ncbi:glycoside hydrolase family 3 N-terminal domain-containing protein [Sphaerisporangium sp. NPDC005288]|uniref:glycoside hydrolase family 3 N-terminal domain-containing protein n=1 Tax=Sphaerisporangium sp. NPDC005288 TaxID=3155114 RepID=UPI0033AF0749
MNELDHLVRSCMLPGVTGAALPSWVSEGLEAGFPGITVFPGAHLHDPATIGRLAAAAREHRDDALVSLDEEGGDVTRLEYGTGSSYPGNLALGVVDDEDLTGRVAAAMARGLVSNGVNYNLAPSVDVNSDPDNPIIGVRSFGATPERVAPHGAAFIGAMQDAGVAVAAKHFPGHGDTTADPHRSLPTVTCSAATLRLRELVPFAAVADAASLMVAHVVYTALDAGSPATLSPVVLRDVLRAELGYQGVALSTAVAIEAGNGPEAATRAAVATLAAGCDLVLLGPAVDEALYARVHAAVADAVRSGDLPAAALEEASERVSRMRRRFAPRPGAGRHRETAAADAAVGMEAARRAVRARGRVGLPGPATVVEVRTEANSVVGGAAWSLADALAAHGLTRRAVRIDGPGAAIGQADGPLVIAVRDAYRTPWTREWTQKALAERPDAILVVVGMPDDEALAGEACVCTFGAGRANLRAAAELLARS